MAPKEVVGASILSRLSADVKDQAKAGHCRRRSMRQDFPVVGVYHGRIPKGLRAESVATLI